MFHWPFVIVEGRVNIEKVESFLASRNPESYFASHKICHLPKGSLAKHTHTHKFIYIYKRKPKSARWLYHKLATSCRHIRLESTTESVNMFEDLEW